MPASPTDGRRDHTVFHQYRADRARRTLPGIDEQVGIGMEGDRRQSGDHMQPIRPNDRRRQLSTIRYSPKTRALAGLKGYVTNLPDRTADLVIGAYHQLWRVEKAFRMSKHDLQAADQPPRARLHRRAPDHRDGRPRRLEWVETATGWPIRTFVTTAPPLPGVHHPGRRPCPHRRRPRPRRPRPSDRRNRTPINWALLEPSQVSWR
jgi:hypothetical protein